MGFFQEQINSLKHVTTSISLQQDLVKPRDIRTSVISRAKQKLRHSLHLSEDVSKHEGIFPKADQPMARPSKPPWAIRIRQK